MVKRSLYLSPKNALVNLSVGALANLKKWEKETQKPGSVVRKAEMTQFAENRAYSNLIRLLVLSKEFQ